MKTYDAIIIGGGLSGLSAAVDLAVKGYKVCLLEQRPHCGGRAYSFVDSTTGDIVDNGQHLMMGCYNATRSYLYLIGTGHLSLLQPTLRIQFLNPLKSSSRFACPNLPVPLHLLGGVIGFNAIPIKNRFELLIVIKELLYTSQAKEFELDRISVDEWLTKLGQSDLNRKYLWNIITLGALNNNPKNVSALMLFRVLRAAFFGNRKNSSLLIPLVGLNELLIDPAIRLIESLQGEVKTNANVKSFRIEQTKIQSVSTANGEELAAKTFISAVPWHAFEKFNLQDVSNSKPSGNTKPIFHSSPIISIHIWFDRVITELDFAALLDTRIQWVFNKSRLFDIKNINTSNTQQYLSLVISDAQEFVELSDEQLVQIVLDDLKQVLPETSKAKVIHFLVIKEKRATFLPSPGLESLRPNSQTEFNNLFLAGDWTATGYPATIEGAVLSGKKAAELVRCFLSKMLND